RERAREPERQGPERFRAERDERERPDRGDQRDLEGDRDEDPARPAREGTQVELDADLEEEQDDADVGEDLDLVSIDDVPRRERTDRETDHEIAEHGRETEPSA